MGFLLNIRNFILRFDLFAATPTLRVRGESAYETFWCGIFSLFMIGAFAGIFAGQILNVLEKADIEAITNQGDDPDSTAEISDIRFALGFEKLTFAQVEPYFDIELRIVEQRPN